MCGGEERGQGSSQSNKYTKSEDWLNAAPKEELMTIRKCEQVCKVQPMAITVFCPGLCERWSTLQLDLRRWHIIVMIYVTLVMLPRVCFDKNRHTENRSVVFRCFSLTKQ